MNADPNNNLFKPDQLAPEPETEKMVRILIENLDAALSSSFTTETVNELAGIKEKVAQVTAVAGDKSYHIVRTSLENSAMYEVKAVDPSDHSQYHGEDEELTWFIAAGDAHIYEEHAKPETAVRGQKHPGYTLSLASEIHDIQQKLNGLTAVADAPSSKGTQ